jgi:hypothetical protein
MNWAELHLLLNHIPPIGLVIGIVLLVVAAIRKNLDLIKVSLSIFVVMAIVAIPTYSTGEPAYEIIKNLPGVSEAIVEQHEDVAGAALAAILTLGAISLMGLFLSFAAADANKIPKWPVALSLILSIVSGILMMRAANLGGQVRHTEIRAADNQPLPEAPKTEGEKKEEREEEKER